jgi:RTA1 like protein
MTNNLIADIIQATFILLPPAFFAATIYMCLSRIIYHVGGEHLSLVPVRWLTRFFVGGDVISIGIQAAVANPKFGNIGKWFIVVALFIQLISFGLFGLTALIFHTRIRKSPTEKLPNVDRSWISTMFMLYGLSGLIILRSIFRVVEYVMGTNGYPLTHEWTLYAFDTLPMLNVALAFCLWYPSNLSGKKSTGIQLEGLGSE